MNRPGGDTRARSASRATATRSTISTSACRATTRRYFSTCEVFLFFVMPGLVLTCPGIQSKKDVDELGHDVERKRGDLRCYSITAWSGASDCLRKEALVEPIMIASGIAHSVNSITIW